MGHEIKKPSYIPPQSVQSEQSLLGCLLINPKTLDEVADLIVVEDFYNHKHKLIYKAIMTLEGRSEPIDAITVSDMLDELGDLEQVGGLAYVGQIANNTVGTVNVASYAKTVSDKAIERKLLEAAYSVEEIVRGTGETQEKADRCEAIVLAAAEERETSKAKMLSDVAGNFIDQIEKRMNHDGGVIGLSTGFERLDRRTSGLQPGDLIIVAGRPSMGKTTLARNIAENVTIEQGKTAVIYSIEESAEQFYSKTTSAYSSVDNDKIKNGNLNDDELTRITNSVARIDSAKMIIDDSTEITALQIKSRSRKIKRQHGLDLIVVDYLQMMNIPRERGENLTNAIGRVTRQLKIAAKELNVPIILLSQLNRTLENRANKRPIMADLRDSGSIEQDADIIWFVYRDEQYNSETVDKGLSEIITAKYRSGKTGPDTLEFEGQYSRFSNTPRIAQSRSTANEPAQKGYDA